MSIPEQVKQIQTEERILDLLSRVRSLETQMLEKSEDIQQLADEVQVIRNLSGVQEKLEAGAVAVATEPMPLTDADLERAFEDMSRAMRGPREVFSDEIATTRPYKVTCSHCGEVLAFNDGEVHGRMVGVHDC